MNLFYRTLLALLAGLCGYFVYTFLYEFINTNTYAIDPHGREILARKSQLWIFVLVMGMFHLIQILISVLFISKKKLESMGVGLLSVAMIEIVFSGMQIHAHYDPSERVVQFNKKEWQEADKKPIKMARDIYLNWGRCKSKETIIQALGTPQKPKEIQHFEEGIIQESDQVIYYLTDAVDQQDECYLVFYFGNETEKDCNSIDLCTFGENSVYSFNPYIESH